MNTKQRAHIIAAIGTIILMLLLWLLLWFVYLGMATPEEEDLGVEVAFGQVEEAGGYMPEQSEAVPLHTSAAAPEPQPAADQSLMTQEDEAALALQKQREREERQRREAEEAERRAKEQAAAERKAREDAAIAKANAMGSLFGNNGSEAQGSGDGKGAGQKGNPVGHGSMGGSQWSLSGRTAKAIPQPANTFSQEGIVVVNIQVDATGHVVSATLGTGSTLSDKSTTQLALDAARKAVFSEGDQAKQIGTITYHFKFK